MSSVLNANEAGSQEHRTRGLVKVQGDIAFAVQCLREVVVIQDVIS